MPIPVVCAGCAARLNAPDAAAGKRLKCPKCQAAITVPALMPAQQFEVVEDDEPVQPTPKPTSKLPAKPKIDVELDDEEEPKPRKKLVKVVEHDEDEEDEPKPKKKAKAIVAETEDEKPRKKKKKAAEDEDEEDEPRKKKKKKSADGALVRNIVGGVVLVILLGVVGFVYWDKFGAKKEEPAPSTSSGNDPPRSSLGSPAPNNQVPSVANNAKVTQAARVMNEWLDLLKGITNTMNQVTDAESARQAVQDIDKATARVRQLTADWKAIGQLTAADQATLEGIVPVREMTRIQQSTTTAMKDLGQRLSRLGMPAVAQPVLEAIGKFGTATIAFGEAIKQADGRPKP